MDTTPIEFTRASNVSIEPVPDSLILLVNMSPTGELMSLSCIEQQWVVTMSHGNNTVNIAWTDFVKIFSEFSVFVAQQGIAMVDECRREQVDPDDYE